MSARSLSTPASRRPAAAGFTMIELLIALAIFAVGVLTLAAIIPSGARRSDSAGQQTRASEFAAAQAEALLDVTYNDGDLSAGSHDDTANPHLRQYYVSWNVEVDAPIANCKRVTVSVRRSSTLGPVLARLVILKPRTEG
jgi:type IV pilus assembly protein PilV